MCLLDIFLGFQSLYIANAMNSAVSLVIDILSEADEETDDNLSFLSLSTATTCVSVSIMIFCLV